ncbi:MAG: peptidoglycan editing factor PgeF [Lachnospiraceae bacterium]|nr:peptidoglycan editing factor PgeF [Lachnospiraceae bacterium]
MQEQKIEFQISGEAQMPLLGQTETAGRIFPYLYYPLLEETGIVSHCFTTRLGGVSKGMFESLNLSFSRGDVREDVEENFCRVAQALKADRKKFVLSHQTHTTNVRRVGKEDAGKGITKDQDFSDVDGLITNEPGLVLTTLYADCVPLYFVDPVHRAIGLSHSGWRGTVGRMGKVTLEAMEREFHTRPEEVLCAIGPSICQKCYEVSQDVAAEFQREFSGQSEAVLEDKGNGKYQLDLWKANEIVLLEAGVKQEHLAASTICTCCNNKLLFSHRASQGKRGNLGAFLGLKAEKG